MYVRVPLRSNRRISTLGGAQELPLAVQKICWTFPLAAHPTRLATDSCSGMALAREEAAEDFWSNAGKAWRFASVGRLKPRNHTIEGFFVERDDRGRP